MPPLNLILIFYFLGAHRNRNRTRPRPCSAVHQTGSRCWLHALWGEFNIPKKRHDIDEHTDSCARCQTPHMDRRRAIMAAPRPRSRNTGRGRVRPVPDPRCGASGPRSQAPRHVSGEFWSQSLDVTYALDFCFFFNCLFFYTDRLGGRLVCWCHCPWPSWRIGS